MNLEISSQCQGLDNLTLIAVMINQQKEQSLEVAKDQILLNQKKDLDQEITILKLFRTHYQVIQWQEDIQKTQFHQCLVLVNIIPLNTLKIRVLGLAAAPDNLYPKQINKYQDQETINLQITIVMQELGLAVKKGNLRTLRKLQDLVNTSYLIMLVRYLDIRCQIDLKTKDMFDFIYV